MGTRRAIAAWLAFGVGVALLGGIGFGVALLDAIGLGGAEYGAALLAAYADEADPPAPTGGAGATTGGAGATKTPAIRVDVKRRTVVLTGQVNLRLGLVEVFACAPHGKTHEAVLTLDCKPEDLQVALISLGLTPTRGQVETLGDGAALTGERVNVYVAWDDDETGERVEYRAEDLVLDHQSGETMERCGFVFTGSRFLQVGERQVFAANASGQMITTFHDPDAILDNPLAKGADDTIYYANSRVLPLAKTPVELRIVPIDDAHSGADRTDSAGTPLDDGTDATDAPDKTDAPDEKD